MNDITIIGGGIVGLATARALALKHPGLKLTLLEKEPEVARHQTGHNSGVIHTGIYYKPGTLKARLCVDGARRMLDYCERHGIASKRCGKVIVATSSDEVPRLEALAERAQANGVPGVEMIGPERLKEIEPHTAGVRALWSPNTAIADYKAVCAVMREELRAHDVEIRLSAKVTGIAEYNDSITIETSGGALTSRRLINCGGLHSDVIARMLGLASEVQIVPFRGEYYFVKPERSHLVNGLIYPVPDPNFPFLGVHFTITVHGEVEAGPNAVLAFAREGYSLGTVNTGELAQTLGFPGFQRLARKWWRAGAYEYYRSFSKREFVRSLQKLVPEIQPDDVMRGGAGVRATAVSADGALVDDFRFLTTARSLHVVNTASPAATASLAIGEYVTERADALFGV